MSPLSTPRCSCALVETHSGSDGIVARSKEDALPALEVHNVALRRRA